MDDVVTAATSLTSAATAFSEAPGYSAISRGTGYISGMASYQTDLAAYQNALASGNTGEQAEAMAGLISDVSSVTGAAATAAAGVSGPAAQVFGYIAGAADILGGVAAGAQVTIGAANWLTNYLGSVSEALMGGALEESTQMQQLDMNDPNGNAVIVMPGQAGDTLVENTSTLGGATAFQYNEENTQGVQTSGVLLAMNGATDAEYVSGQGVVSDVNGFQVNIANGVSATVAGSSNMLTAGSNASLNVSGSSNSTTVTGTGTTVNDSGSSDSAILNGNNDTDNLAGNGSVGNALGASDTVSVTGTNDVANAFTTATNANLNLFGNNDADNLAGSGNFGNALGANDTVSVTGTNDVANAFATATNANLNLFGNNDTDNLAGSGNFGNALGANDTVSVTGTNDVANAFATATNANLNLFGNNDTDNLAGSGNFGNALGANDTVSVTGTNDVANAFATATNANLNLFGNNDTDNLAGSGNFGNALGANDTVSVTGTNDVADAFATATNANLNLLGNNGTANVQGNGVKISGGNDVVNLAGTGKTLDLLDGNGYQVTATSSTINTGANTALTLLGSGNSINSGSNSAVAINGTGNMLYAGSNSVVLDNGVNNTINATDSVIQLGSQNMGQTIYIYGNGNTIDAATLLSSNPVVQADIVVRGTGNTIIASNQKIDLNDTTGNFVTSNNAVSYNNPNAYSYVSGASLSGTYGPLNPAAPSTPGVYFPDYNPGVGGTGGSFTNGGVWNGDPNIAGQLPGYDLPLDDCSGTGYNPDGTYNIVVCGTADDPLMLNLNGGSVETTALSASPVSFDMQNNGQKVQTGWGTAGEGYIVYDPNDAANTTVVTQDSQLVAGFGALQGLAQQVDGSVDDSLTASDALWNSLKVWVDTTGTGEFQSGQLYNLDQLGIASINLNGTQVDQNSNGNQILVESTFTYANGNTGDIAGVNLMFNPNATQSAPAADAGLADIQINKLIAGMASYGAQPAASSVLVSAAATQESMLAASAH
ncbi:hypothetical protein PQR67_13530 [Paraburkholderia fungorum]|uniref:beta strand repeat-containing protein n=1 Tax=Paraburkholderia fungorum TaxID=134537 RepID=UPI0038B9972C